MSSAKMKKVKKCAALDKQHTDAEKKSARATERARQQRVCLFDAVRIHRALYVL